MSTIIANSILPFPWLVVLGAFIGAGVWVLWTGRTTEITTATALLSLKPINELVSYGAGWEVLAKGTIQRGLFSVSGFYTVIYRATLVFNLEKMDVVEESRGTWICTLPAPTPKLEILSCNLEHQERKFSAAEEQSVEGNALASAEEQLKPYLSEFKTLAVKASKDTLEKLIKPFLPPNGHVYIEFSAKKEVDLQEALSADLSAELEKRVAGEMKRGKS